MFVNQIIGHYLIINLIYCQLKDLSYKDFNVCDKQYSSALYYENKQSNLNKPSYAFVDQDLGLSGFLSYQLIKSYDRISGFYERLSLIDMSMIDVASGGVLVNNAPTQA